MASEYCEACPLVATTVQSYTSADGPGTWTCDATAKCETCMVESLSIIWPLPQEFAIFHLHQATTTEVQLQSLKVVQAQICLEDKLLASFLV